MNNTQKIEIFQGDITDEMFEFYNSQNVLAVDTETSGLDPERNDLQLIQVASRDDTISLVQFRKHIPPRNIRRLTANDQITKVIHYATFDRKFLEVHAKATLFNVFCTKLASEQVRGVKGPKGYHKLNTISKEILGVELDKSLMDPYNLPDWTGELTPKHIEYASGDVVVLIPLYDYFIQKLTNPQVKTIRAKAETQDITYF